MAEIYQHFYVYSPHLFTSPLGPFTMYFILNYYYLHVSGTIWCMYFAHGLNIGAPTVFIPQIRKEANSTAAVSEEMASWLSSMAAYAGLPWVFIIPVITYYVGRKIPYIILSAALLIGYICLYLSTSIKHILLSEIVFGIVVACHHTMSPVMIVEYSSKNYRGIFLSLKSASVYWGIWTSNAIGTFFYWKNICYLGIVCALFSIISVLFWPESPYWLAANDRHEQCTKSHRWLYGVHEESEKELKALLDSETKSFEIKERKRKGKSHSMLQSDMYKIVTDERFYKSYSLSVVLMLLTFLSGKLSCMVYAIEIVKKITHDESVAYKIMLILDGITVVASYAGSVLSKYISRRSQLIPTSIMTVVFLFILSFYLYLVKLKIVVENNLLTLCILSLYSISACVGPLIMASSLFGELAVKYKTVTMVLIGFGYTLLMAVSLKITPLIFRVMKTYGAFLFYGLNCTVFIIILYKYLPETKDKTPLEIENSFKREPQNENIPIQLKPLNTSRR